MVRPCIEMTYKNDVLFCVDSHTLDFIPSPCDKKGLCSYTGYPILYYVHTCSISRLPLDTILKQESKKEFLGVCKASKVLMMKCFLAQGLETVPVYKVSSLPISRGRMCSHWQCPAIIAPGYKCEYNP